MAKTKQKQDIRVTEKRRLIDKVTTELLDVTLRACSIAIPIEIVDNIIDVVELLEDKGGKTTIKDITKLQQEWKRSNNTKSDNNGT